MTAGLPSERLGAHEQAQSVSKHLLSPTLPGGVLGLGSHRGRSWFGPRGAPSLMGQTVHGEPMGAQGLRE